MNKQILGIHHVTAIAGDPQQNLDFYTGVLGLRLVKLTVNYDDPQTYHFYYGDAHGHPGTILISSMAERKKGRQGHGQVTVTAFSVPEPAFEFWAKRLSEQGVQFEGPYSRFQEQVITFSDPDGLRLELVAGPELSSEKRELPGPIPPSTRFTAFTTPRWRRRDTKGLRLSLPRLLDSGWFSRKVDVFGSEDAVNRVRSWMFVCMPDSAGGSMGSGTVHHIAWRTADDPQQSEWHTEIARQG